MNFRYDINGLRAIAVVGVVLYHFNASWLAGGFAGVDVFFVISGFLMTGVVVKGLEGVSFSILGFYKARANRIIPALAFLCFCVFVFGWFCLTPVDNRLLGQHLASSATFLSNFIYLRESGYFDPSSHGKWLLHTWSLSAEWQFYIIYPVALVFLNKFLQLENFKKVILLSAVLGFMICVVGTHYKPAHAYFLLPTRAWEMLLGGVAYLYPWSLKAAYKKAVELVGVSLILFSYVFFSEEFSWPGYWSLVPVLGTFLVIQSNRTDSIFTNNYVFQKIGGWSYSVYLWHWPLVVLGGYYSLGPQWPLLGIPLSFLFGYLSFRYIEGIRYDSKVEGWMSIIQHPPFIYSFVAFFLGVFMYLSDGLVFKYPQSIQIVSLEATNKNPRYKECQVSTGTVPECVYGEGEVGLIVLGDSHAGAVVRSVENAKPEHLERGVLDWTMSGCPTVSGVYQEKSGAHDYSCGEFVSSRFEVLKQEYKGVPVVYSSRVAAYIDGPNEQHLRHKVGEVRYQVDGHEVVFSRGAQYQELILGGVYEALCEVAESNPLYIVKPIPTLRVNVPKTMARELLSSNENFRVKVSKSYYSDRNADVLELYQRLAVNCGVKLLEVDKYFCDERYCYGDVAGRPIYFDDNHLSVYGADLLIPEFRRAWLSEWLE